MKKIGSEALRQRIDKINDSAKVDRGSLKVDHVSVNGITLRTGDRVRWVNFGGYAWTGTGSIAGIMADAGALSVIGVTFDRTPELDAKRTEFKAAISGFNHSDSNLMSVLRIARIEQSYPFGERDGPVLFTADAALYAINNGMFTVVNLKAWNNGTETVIAYSADDASDVLAAHLGEKKEDYSWTWLENTNSSVTIVIDTDRGNVTQTLTEWIAETGRGVLCSSEW